MEIRAMAKYRAYVCSFLDFEAEDDTQAEVNALSELLRKATNNELGISIWQSSEPQGGEG
jgi:hypothetical protein